MNMVKKEEVKQILHSSEGETGKVVGLDEVAINEILREIKNRIVRSFNPMRIVLFGSYASGIPNEDSDLDLLVVMESNESPIKRTARVSKIFRDRKLPMDIIVRTPQEIKCRLDVGDFFIKEILEEGKILYERDSKGMG